MNFTETSLKIRWKFDFKVLISSKFGKKLFTQMLFLVTFNLVSFVGINAQDENRLLSQALFEEEINGDLESAIRIYKEIFELYRFNRPVAAEVLLRLGITHEKLGLAQAAQYYDQVVNQFPDQTRFVIEARRRKELVKGNSAPTEAIVDNAIVVSNDQYIDVDHIRDHKVAVMVFENHTNLPELENLGLMMSDWITTGMIELNRGKVISSANVLKRLDRPLMEFIKETGADVVIKGRYYLLGEELIINANVVGAYAGEVIYSLDPIRRHRNEVMAIVDEITQKLLGFWATSHRDRYFKEPPKYEAYKLFIEASTADWMTNDLMAEQKLKEAFKIDSNFYEVLLKLGKLYMNNNRFVSTDSLLEYIGTQNPDFGIYEQLQFDALRAELDGNLVLQASSYEKMAEIDPTTAAFMSGLSNLRIRRTERALRYFERSARLGFGEDETMVGQFDDARMLDCRLMLGQDNEVLEYFQNQKFIIISAPLAGHHLRVLLRIADFDGLERAINRYVNLPLVPNRATPLLALCLELYQMGHEKLSDYADRFLIENEKIVPGLWQNIQNGWAYFFKGDLHNSALSFSQIKLKDQLGNQFAPLYWGRHIPILHLNHDVEKARRLAEALSDWPTPTRIQKGAIYYSLGLYHAVKEEKELAMDYLIKAYNHGVGFEWYLFGGDPMLSSMKGYEPFEQFVQPLFE